MNNRDDLTQPIIIPLIAEGLVMTAFFALWLAWWVATP